MTERGRKINSIWMSLVLLVYPLLQVTQGIDITDTTYSLGNYRFFLQTEGMWTIATYLSNVCGFLLMQLPGGRTLLGMNVYTGLIVSATALVSFHALKKWLPDGVVWIGEIIAMSYCWCPTTILYNYLTYLLFNAVVILLLYAFCQGKKWFYVLAGVILGLNVMVRFSNIPEAALILVVWYGEFLKKRPVKSYVEKTMLCLAGYLAGFVAIILVIMLQYGSGAYLDMISGLFGMTDEASDYTLAGMLMSIASAYMTSIRWMLYLIAGTVLGELAGWILDRSPMLEKVRTASIFPQLVWIFKIGYAVGLILILRLYWGHGMYTTRYYDYEAIFQWGMFLVILSLAGAVFTMWKGLDEERVYALAVILVILLTPIGSNNYTFPILNNLFLIAPFFVWMVWRLVRYAGGKLMAYPAYTAVIVVLLMCLIQGVLFGNRFVFRDGIDGMPRDSRVEHCDRLAGMRTTSQNAASLQGLVDYTNETLDYGEKIILWGDAPGLSFILDRQPAIFTSWPEIPSNTYDNLDDALMELEDTPAIILHNDTGRPLIEDKKSDLILDFIAEKNYDMVYENNNYKVYMTKGRE